MKIIFLGTGASGGTAGSGKSERMESSVILTDNGLNILIDTTRDFQKQIKDYKIDAVLLTHGHKDACAGIKKLPSGIRVFAHPKTLARIKTSFKPAGLKLIPVKETQKMKIGPWTAIAYEVPHTKDQRFPTYAWKLSAKKTIIYASDIAFITEDFKKICDGTDLLIIDGSTWKRKIFSHLRVDEDLPKLCRLNICRIILTQIGKSTPPHEKFKKEITKICPRAAPAYDSLIVTL